jgi:hypothetical protein
MESLLSDYPAGLLAPREPPCVSLYQPTHRHHPDNRQDPIRFQNHVKALEDVLGRSRSSRQVGELLEPFRALAGDRDFWNHTLDGLAVLASAGEFRVYRLQRPVPDRVIVADSFHTKPLLRIVQSADRFQLLGIGLREMRLFEGNRDAVDEIEPAGGVPRTITDALGEEITEPHLTVASYGQGAGGPAMHHGHGSRKDEVDADTERFFRAVDRAVLEHHSRPSGLPLLLAALPEHQSVFRQVSRNPFLLPVGIDANPDALTPSELRERAWRAVEPRYLARLAGLIEEFGRAAAGGLGSGDVADVARAAVAGRVATLLVDADREVPGRMDAATGRIDLAAEVDAETDDLLDDVGEAVLRSGGDVVVVPAARMPTESGLAAIFRYAG